MSNFQFLHKEWPQIFEIAKEAEDMVNDKPIACSMFSRQALEKGINWMYENDSRLLRPSIDTLGALITDRTLKPLLDKSQRRDLLILQQIGNAAVHRRDLKENEKQLLKQFGPDQDVNVNSNRDLANVSIKLLFKFCSFLAISYSEEEIDIPLFNESLIPTGTITHESQKELESKVKNLQDQIQNDKIKREALETQKVELESLRKELELKSKKLAQRAESRANKVRNIPQLIPESVTRKLYIDVLLKEAGWNSFVLGHDIEYEVTGMPQSVNPTGKGYVDYVLWNKEGVPLAVIEAKRINRSEEEGKQQAKLYADCIHQMFPQYPRPIIFYTNGYNIQIWDDVRYPPRIIHGFLNEDELTRLINKRTEAKNLTQYQVKEHITGRPYQKEAIRRVAERWQEKHRKALLVMATGTGKTRTAVSIVDMLMKCNWAKRILFLADRNALVTQAKNAFKELLKEVSAIDLTKEAEDLNTRMVFSTYPTIMNRIDSVKNEGQPMYGVGHFDLVIIDEAHRSVYKKYGAIFDYFDSLLLGLTATPITHIDRNTYDLFEIEHHNPTYAYELNTAVEQKYLVPPKGKSIPVGFLRGGVKYNDLSQEEKEEYELKFGNPTEEEVSDSIAPSAMNQTLFNSDTIDKVLKYTMENGIKVQGDEKIGKTIVFARNHKHAKLIEKRFDVLYPQYRGDFLRVIDNQEKKAQSLIESFVDPYKERNPQIAVSVDMMDTGIDAPRVVNLVFFKPVKSLSKFWQMIGRGTRLCPDLFGPNQDKEEFYILDFCENLEYFEYNPDGLTAKNQLSITERIFHKRIEIIRAVAKKDNCSTLELQLQTELKNIILSQIQALDTSRFDVKMNLQFVEKYKYEATWNNIGESEAIELKENISGLLTSDESDNELSRRFDLVILAIQMALISGTEGTKPKSKLMGSARQVSKVNVPDVVEKMSLLKEVQSEGFWQVVDVYKLEDVRIELRELMKYLQRESKAIFYTNFTDTIEVDHVSDRDIIGIHENLEPYRQRVEQFIRSQSNHLTIHKLKNNIPITKGELEAVEQMLLEQEDMGTRDQFDTLKKESGFSSFGSFIRSIVGLDIQAANSAFSQFIAESDLNASQMKFIETIIQYLNKNGFIDKGALYEPPFTYMHLDGIEGVFSEGNKTKVFSILDAINENAEVG